MLAVGAIQALILLVALARAKFLSFAIGTEGYGIAATIDQLVIAMVSIGSAGLPFVAIKMLSQSHSESEERFEQRYAGFFAALLTLGLLTSFIGVALVMLAPQIFGAELARYRLLIAIAIAAIPALMLNILLANALAAAQRPRQAAVFTLAVQATLLAATVIGALAGGLSGIYIATVIAGTIATIVAAAVFQSRLGWPVISSFARLSQEMRRERKIVGYAFWTYAATAIYALALSALRTSTFSNLGAAAAGFLAGALSLALAVGAVVNPISNLLLTPFVNRTIPVHEKISASNDFLMRMLTVVLIISLPIVLFPQLSVRLLFAPAFIPAASIVLALVTWQCVSQFGNVYTQILIGLDDLAFACIATIAGNGAILLLAPSVTERMGIAGAATLLIGGSLVCGSISAIRLSSKFHVGVSRGAFFRLLFVLAVIAGSRVLGKLLTETTPSGFAARVVYAGLSVSILLAMLSRAERDWLSSLTSRRFRSAAQRAG
jgi:O-antigen/teichoic acid export membrane protein